MYQEVESERTKRTGRLKKWERARQTERKRQREPPQPQRKPADCSAAKAQTLFQTIPDHMHAVTQTLTCGRWMGEGRGDTQGRKRTRHKTHTEKRPRLSKHKEQTRTHTSTVMITAAPPVLWTTHAFWLKVGVGYPSDVVPGSGRVFGIVQHAHRTQDSSCPGLKDELQKHKCSSPLFKEDPFGHPKS